MTEDIEKVDRQTRIIRVLSENLGPGKQDDDVEMDNGGVPRALNPSPVLPNLPSQPSPEPKDLLKRIEAIASPPIATDNVAEATKAQEEQPQSLLSQVTELEKRVDGRMKELQTNIQEVEDELLEDCIVIGDMKWRVAALEEARKMGKKNHFTH